MAVRSSLGWLVPAGLLVTAAPALAQSNCGRPPCNTTQTVKALSVFPTESDFRLRGDSFQNSQIVDLKLANGFAAVTVPFTINVGATQAAGKAAAVNALVAPAATATTTFYVNQNGTVTFDRPLETYSAVTQLSDLGAQVIAPFYANLMTGPGSGDGQPALGDVIVQIGQADPYPNGGRYDPDDLRDAVRITWYGLNDGPLAASGAAQNPVLAQLLIAADQDGLTSFEFRYGDANDARPYQAGYESIAGFALGDTQVQFSGPYTGEKPSFFEFYRGQYVGQLGTPIAAGVPEPATWPAMILGFGLAGGAIRRRRLAVNAPASA